MKVIVCHNFYQQPGGEDQVFADETALLERHGHAVVRYTVDNDAIAAGGGRVGGRLKLLGDTLWNRDVAAEIGALVRRERADVVHFHNTFPLISPAAYYAARAAGAAVVQTLHNYRLLCPGATFYREGRVCEDCLGRSAPWPAVAHGCYRGSRAATAATAALLTAHRGLGTWRRQVDAYVALTEFARRKMVQGGLPARRVAVKPNFIVNDPGPGDGAGGYAVFVGRLSPEKGVQTLLDTWCGHEMPVPLKVLGDGELTPMVREAAARCPRVEWLGRRLTAEVLDVIGGAAFMVAPSLWYEGFPKIIAEAFAKGTPVLASRLGSLAEVVEHGRTGAHFEAGNAAALAAQVRQLASDAAALSRMRREARREFEAKYTAERNYCLLMDVYTSALRRRRRALSACGARGEVLC